MTVDAPSRETRLLPVEGGFNFRDCGGYAAADGGSVKWGMLYRSGTMAYLTEADDHHLRGLGIATICDLRRGNEREAEPTRWHIGSDTHYWTRDYSEISGLLVETLRHAEPSGEKVRQAMLKLYRDIPHDHAPSYRVMFDRLITGGGPLLLNCTAGKDRTGVGIALILHALGVDRDAILADYLLTNEADFVTLFHRRSPQIARMAMAKPEVIAPLFAADADYLTTFFDTMDESHGGIDAYLADVLGVDDQQRARLRQLLLN